MRLVLIAVVCVLQISLSAQEFITNKNQSINLISDNDSYIDMLKPNVLSDKYYTAGQYLSYLSQEFQHSPINEFALLSRLYGDYFSRFSVAIKQEMHTPKDRNYNKFTPQSDDILFGATLYANAAILNRTPDFMEQISLDIGVSGPYAFGKEVQNFVHRITKNPIITGWDYAALKNEIIANLHYGMIYKVRIFDDYIDALPQFQLSLGNALISANFGIKLRIGGGLSNDFGLSKLKSRFHQNIISDALKIYGVIGVNKSVVWRDIFIDGNTFKHNSGVKANRFVDEFEIGAMIGYKHFSLGYLFTQESKRFKEQKAGHKYGSFVMEFVF